MQITELFHFPSYGKLQLPQKSFPSRPPPLYEVCNLDPCTHNSDICHGLLSELFFKSIESSKIGQPQNVKLKS